MSDLRCRQCGARMQPTAEWCSLCHTRKAALVAAGGTSLADEALEPTSTSSSLDSPPEEAHPRRGGEHRKRTRRPQAMAGAAIAATAAVVVAVVLSVGSSGSHSSDKPPHAPKHNNLGIPSGVTGIPTNGRIPTRISR
jgi:hypothetical protein